MRKMRTIIGAGIAAATLTTAGCFEATPEQYTEINSCSDPATNVAPTYDKTAADYSPAKDPMVLVEQQKRDLQPDKTGQQPYGIGSVVCEVTLKEGSFFGSGDSPTAQVLTLQAMQVGANLDDDLASV